MENDEQPTQQPYPPRINCALFFTLRAQFFKIHIIYNKILLGIGATAFWQCNLWKYPTIDNVTPYILRKLA